MKAKILVCHGANDPLVPDEEVLAVMQGMRAAKTNWQLNAYSDAVHRFTQPSANRKGVAEYNEQAAKRSWRAMKASSKSASGSEGLSLIAIPRRAVQSELEKQVGGARRQLHTACAGNLVKSARARGRPRQSRC